MTLLIKNARVIDGSGKAAITADVLIKRDKIVAIADSIKYKAGKIIDAMGAYLAPGFIGVNSQSANDLDILKNQNQENLLKRGITSIIGGHNGFSLSPLIYGSLESFRPFADIRGINVNWHSLAEFFKTFRKRRLGINFGTLIGHSTMRFDIVHNIRQGEFRQLTENEIMVLIFMARNGLKDGALGISVGLDNPLVAEASYFEIKKMAELAAKAGVLLSLNLKDNQDGLMENIKKAIFLAKETGVKIFINNFRPSQEALALIEENSNSADILVSANYEFNQIINNDRALVSSEYIGEFFESGILPIEEIIRKITFLPATKFKLKNRGLVKEGYFADLLIFKDSQIRTVILNGRRVFDEGKYCGILSGEILR